MSDSPPCIICIMLRLRREALRLSSVWQGLQSVVEPHHAQSSVWQAIICIMLSQARSPTFVVSVARLSVSRRTSSRTVVSVASHHLYNVVSQARSPTFVVRVTRPSVSRRTSSRTVGSTPGSSRLPVTRAPGRSSARWTFDVTQATSISLKRDDTNVKYRHGARFTKYLTDNLTIMPKLRSTYDGRLIYIRSHEEGKAFCRYDSLAKW